MNRGLRDSKGAIALDNDKFRSFAFDTHVPAYVNSGLLDLGVKDKMRIGATPDFGDMMTFDGIKQASIIGVLEEVRLFNSIFARNNNNSRERTWGDVDTKN